MNYTGLVSKLFNRHLVRMFLDFVETSSATEGTPQEVNVADAYQCGIISSSFDSLVTEGECDKLHLLDCPDLQSALSDPRHSRIKEHRICGCVF